MSIRQRKALQFVEVDKLHPSANCDMAPLSRSVARGKLHALGAGAGIVRQELLALFTRNPMRPWHRRRSLPHTQNKAAFYSGFVFSLPSITASIRNGAGGVIFLGDAGWLLLLVFDGPRSLLFPRFITLNIVGTLIFIRRQLSVGP